MTARLSQKQITWTIRIGVILAAVLLILVWATRADVVSSDNAAVVGALLALIGVLITQAVNTRLAQEAREHQQEIENERAQDDALQEYLNQISDPKTYKPLRKAAKQGYRRAVMRAKLKTLLLRLNGERKGILLLFLHEAKLIKREEELLKRKMEEKLLEKEGGKELLKRKMEEEEEEEEKDKREKWNYPILSLKDIDLSETRLNSAVLVHDDLSGANVSKADLMGADLSNTNLRGSILRHAKLDPYVYRGVDKMYDTPTKYSTPVNLSGADLREAEGLTEEQIAQAIGDRTTQLPDGIKHPEAWDKRFKEQLRRIGELTASVTAVDPVDGTAVLEEAPSVSGGDRV